MFKGMIVIPIAALLSIFRIVAADSLVVQPQHPTTADSIRFTIGINLPCNCFQQFFPDSMVVLNSDTVIRLSYQEGVMACNNMVCIDTLPLVRLSFKSGSLAAGTYPVYELASPYCAPGTICQGLVRLLKIGSIDVTAPVSARQNSVNPMAFGKRSSATGERMYNIRGELIGSKANKTHPAGCVILSDKNHTFMVKEFR